MKNDKVYIIILWDDVRVYGNLLLLCRDEGLVYVTVRKYIKSEAKQWSDDDKKVIVKEVIKSERRVKRKKLDLSK